MKTKYITILVAMFISSISIAQNNTLKAFFIGFDKEYQTYLFEDADGSTIEFNKVSSNVLKKFNLNTPEFVDEAFLITYTTLEIEDEDSDDLQEENTITKLELTLLKKNKNSDEDEDSDDDE
jgi:hypothetical protein